MTPESEYSQHACGGFHDPCHIFHKENTQRLCFHQLWVLCIDKMTWSRLKQESSVNAFSIFIFPMVSWHMTGKWMFWSVSLETNFTGVSPLRWKVDSFHVIFHSIEIPACFPTNGTGISRVGLDGVLTSNFVQGHWKTDVQMLISFPYKRQARERFRFLFRFNVKRFLRPCDIC